MIEAHQLVKRFEEFEAVRGISFTVPQGELLALLGPNGAGKTTTIRMISSILKPTSGWARINGYDAAAESDQVRHAIGMLTEQPGLYERMTGIEYLLFYGRLYGLNDQHIKERGLALFERFNMPNTAHRRLGEYSKGMKQKVGLIRAMLHNPAVLLLDEPTSAMDPHSAKLVRDAIGQLRRDKRSVVLCTHNLNEAELLADRIAIINAGRLVAQGTAAELKQQLLGDRIMKLTVNRPLNGELSELEALVAVENVQENIIHYRTADPLQTNPQVVNRLTGLGLGVVTLTEISQTLEDVYLNVVTNTQDEVALQGE